MLLQTVSLVQQITTNLTCGWVALVETAFTKEAGLVLVYLVRQRVRGCLEYSRINRSDSKALGFGLLLKSYKNKVSQEPKGDPRGVRHDSTSLYLCGSGGVVKMDANMTQELLVGFERECYLFCSLNIHLILGYLSVIINNYCNFSTCKYRGVYESTK